MPGVTFHSSPKQPGSALPGNRGEVLDGLADGR